MRTRMELLAAMAAVIGIGPRRRPSFTRDELRILRRSGNRTAPQWVQDELVWKAECKRHRRRLRNKGVKETPLSFTDALNHQPAA